MRPPLYALVGLVTLLAAPAVARADVIIPAGQTVSYLTLVGGNAQVDGTVTGPVVIIDGSLNVGPHGTLRDGARLFGGHLTAAPGARISGPILQIGSPWPELNAQSAIGLIAALLLIRTLLALAILAIAKRLARRFPRRRERTVLHDRPGRTLLTGALTLTGIAAASVLLVLSVVGIPIAICLAGLTLLGAALGIAQVINPTLEEPGDDEQLVGILTLTPFIGDALLALATIVGLGIGLAAWRSPRAGTPLAEQWRSP